MKMFDPSKVKVPKWIFLVYRWYIINGINIKEMVVMGNGELRPNTTGLYNNEDTLEEALKKNRKVW